MAKKKIHRGQRLDTVVRGTGLRITVVTKRAGYSRSAYYHHIADEKLPYDVLEAYGKAIGYDFTRDFVDMIRNVPLLDPDVLYMSKEELQEEVMKLRRMHAQIMAKQATTSKKKI